MQIVNVDVESSLIIVYDNQSVKLTPFFTKEPGNLKLGVVAPRGLEVNREEVYKRKQEKKNISELVK
jgi:carbon storage regulator